MRLYLLLFCSAVTVLSCNEKNKEDTKSEDLSTIHKSIAIDYKSLVGKDFLIDDLHSYIGFKIKYFGYSPVRGRFDSFDGTIFYDHDNPESFSVTTIIDIESINTGNERRDNDLKKEGGWFDAPKFPLAKFISKEIIAHENGFYLTGDLTIKSVTKSIKIDFEKPLDLSQDSFKNHQFSLYGTFSISREDFDIAGGGFWTTVMENGLTQLSDEVEMEIELHCRRTDYLERYNELDSTDVRKFLLHKIDNQGIEQGLISIDSLHAIEKVSSGALSTVGYILNDWRKENDALKVFTKKKHLFGNSAVIQNQLGVTHLELDNREKAMEAFQNAVHMDSTNSRSVEYIKLLNKINNQ